MSELTQENVLWLKENGRYFEYVLIHRIIHDSIFRNRCRGTVDYMDFNETEFGAIFGALDYAQNCLDGYTEANYEIPVPLPDGWLESYLNAGNVGGELYKEHEWESVQTCLNQLRTQNLQHHWYLVDEFFPTWLSDSKALRLVQRARVDPFVDASKLARNLEEASQDAKSVIYDSKNNSWHDTLFGEEVEHEERMKLGIPPLDDATGGIAEGEAIMIFAGTGGGKTVSVAQAAGFCINISRPSVILTTEVTPPKYVARIISSRCRISIKGLSGCKNVKSILEYIAVNHPDKIDQVQAVIEQIKKFLYIKKVDPEEGMDSQSLLRTTVQEAEQYLGMKPKIGFFDWIGSVADNNSRGGSSDRTVDWERSANGCVKAAEQDSVAWVILAQAVNDSQGKGTLSIGDIGISKGMGKNMVTVIGITNRIDQEQIKAALAEGNKTPMSMTSKEQLLCVCKAREGETFSIPVRTEFQYQRFVVRGDRT